MFDGQHFSTITTLSSMKEQQKVLKAIIVQCCVNLEIFSGVWGEGGDSVVNDLNNFLIRENREVSMTVRENEEGVKLHSFRVKCR